MSQSPSLAPSFGTFADVVISVGQIPPDRIVQDPAPGTATEADVLRLYSQQKRLCELVNGVLVEKSMGAYESLLAMELGSLLNDFVKANDLGVILGEAGMLRLFPGRIRIPDVSFIGWDQLPNREFPGAPVPGLFPELAIEVPSESNTKAEMHNKLHDYFNAGARLVWYLDPDERQMSVFTSPTQMRRVEIDGELDGGDLLPGLKMPMRKIFRVSRATG